MTLTEKVYTHMNINELVKAINMILEVIVTYMFLTLTER